MLYCERLEIEHTIVFYIIGFVVKRYFLKSAWQFALEEVPFDTLLCDIKDLCVRTCAE